MASEVINRRSSRRKRKNYSVDTDFTEDDNQNKYQRVMPSIFSATATGKSQDTETCLVKHKHESELESKPPAKGFMDFPAEIRNKIYDEAFTDPRGIYITRKFCSHGGLGIGHVSQGSALLRVKEQDHGEYRNGEWHFLNKHIEGHSIKRCEVSPNLLGTSKAIRSEGLGLLYQQPFIFINFDVLALFLEPMSATTLAHLRNITILRSRGSPMLREVTKLYPFQLLQGATGLRNLRFGTGTGTGMSLDPMNFDFDLTWRFIRVSSNSKIGDYIAKRFVVVASPFIASFIAQRGMIALLETVKFHFDCHRFTKADQAAILFAMGERIPHYLQHTRNEGLFRGLMA